MSAPSTPQLPQRIVVDESVRQARVWQAQMPVASMARLCELLAAPAGTVAVSLAAAEDSQSLGRIRGVVGGVLTLQCQRCLQAMQQLVTAEVDWTLVATEADEDRLLATRDPVLVEDGMLPVHAAIEDELIMALPIIAVCAEGECPQAEQANDAELVHNDRPSDARPNPFAALKGQLKKP
jgi:uncharacterized protein